MEIVYPKHLYEPIRIEVAKSYIRYEISKYLPSATGEWNKDIDKWFEGSEVGLFPVRDFWNGFYGIVMGFKLYIHLIEFVTAENIKWSKEEIEIEKLSFTDFGESQLSVVSKEPIIVTQKQIEGIDKLVVYDGNNRVNQAIKQGKGTVEAFLGLLGDERRQLHNYWLATPIIYEIYTSAKKAFKEQNIDLYEACVKVLKDMLSDSKSGKYEFMNRVSGKEDEFKSRLINDLGLD